MLGGGLVPEPEVLELEDSGLEVGLEHVDPGQPEFGIGQDYVVLIDEVPDDGLKAPHLKNDGHEVFVPYLDDVTPLDVSLADDEDPAQEVTRPVFLAREYEQG